LPQGVAQWYFLISNDFSSPGVPAAHTAGSIAKINHAFTTTPFGKDIFTEFGDQLSLPIVGNFDPPVAATAPGSSLLAGDYDNNGRVEAADQMVWRASFGMTTNMAADGNHDGKIDLADYVVWRNNVGAVAASSSTSSVLPTDPLAGWTIVEAVESASVEVAEPVLELPATETVSTSAATADVVAIDDFFAQLDGGPTDQGAFVFGSGTAPAYVNDALLLTTLAASIGNKDAPEFASGLAEDGYVDESLVDEFLADFVGVGAEFDSL
ncbi:MAG: hypothetical protein WD468_11690, partial [Pirellulales bacterium]